MINTVLKNEVKKKLSSKTVFNEVLFLPKWEKIYSFSIVENKFFFNKETINLELYRKFSSGNMLEKYSIRTEDGNTLANMDLKVYKDCVYIINLNINTSLNFNKIVEYMLQTAVEKALYNTTEKEVIINLSFGIFIGNKIKKILTSCGFLPSLDQNNLEKKMFGETFFVKINENSFWMKKIKEMSILINK